MALLTWALAHSYGNHLEKGILFQGSHVHATGGAICKIIRKALLDQTGSPSSPASCFTELPWRDNKQGRGHRGQSHSLCGSHECQELCNGGAPITITGAVNILRILKALKEMHTWSWQQFRLGTLNYKVPEVNWILTSGMRLL